MQSKLSEHLCIIRNLKPIKSAEEERYVCWV